MGASTKTKVAVLKASDYSSLEAAVAEALKLINADTIIKPGEKVLLKPNLLMKSIPACTNADFIEAVARALKPYKVRVSLGDSPGQLGNSAKDIVKHTHIDTVMLQENIAYTEFESAAAAVQNKNARHMKNYHIAKAVHDTGIYLEPAEAEIAH